MAIRRCLVELGTGVDMHGKDSTKAARRAVFDALRHSAPAFVQAYEYDPRGIYVDVHIAVPNYDTVRPGEVLLEVPYGIKSINVVEGGLEVPGGGDDATIMANAAIMVSVYDAE